MLRTLTDSNRRANRLSFVSVLVVVLLVGTGIGTVAADAPDCSTVSYSGDGTESSPYEVSNVDQLQCIESQGLRSSYELVSDIDASETSTWNTGKGFDPIGKSTNQGGTPFIGTFDGNGHTITNLIITRGSENNVGLFGGVDTGSTVENVNLERAQIIGGSPSTGALIGSARGGTVSDASANGSVSGADFVGGLVGYTEGTVTGSSVDVDVSGSGNNVGGLVGELQGGTITQSSSVGGVSGGADQVGGLVGLNDGGTMTQSFATGNVDGVDNVGGLVGDNFQGTVTDSYARGDVSSNIGFLVPDVAGALIGIQQGSTVVRSYSTGSVTGGKVGGLIAESDGGNSVQISYWDTQSSGATGSAGGTGLTTNEMIGNDASDNMGGFSFSSPDTWETVQGDYPILTWQVEPTATFTVSSTNPETGEAVTFDASGSSSPNGTVQRYKWDFGDGSTATATGETVTHSYSSSGEYTVTLTVTDDRGETGTTTQTVTVGDEGPTGVLEAIRQAGDNPNSIERQSLQDAIFAFVAGDGTFNGVELTREDLQSAVFEFVTS